MVAMSMHNQGKLCSEFLLEYTIPEDLSKIDLKIKKKIFVILGSIYASLGDRIPHFVDQCIKLDERYNCVVSWPHLTFD